jgi:hypothetical protein
LIHGIYLKKNSKSYWMLFSTTPSAEGAADELKEAIKFATEEGNDDPKAAIKIFDTEFYIPEILEEMVEEKPLYN